MPSIDWTQTTTHSVLPVTCQAQDGTLLPLSGVTSITGAMRPRNIVGSYTNLSGTANVTDAANGKFDFQFAAADVVNWVDFYLVFKIAFSDGRTTVSFPAVFTIVQVV